MAVVATGSAVRPEVTANDLDLVVICNEPKDLQVTRPMEVDLRVYCARDVGGQIRNGHDVLGWGGQVRESALPAMRLLEQNRGLLAG